MKKDIEKHRIVPVRFGPADLQQLEREADSLRLSVATLVRMKVASLLTSETETARE